MTPDAWPDDGLLDICMVEALNRRQIVRLLPSSIKGGHKDSPAVEMRRARAVDIAAEHAFHVHIDGEYIGEHAGPMRFEVLDRVLPVLVMKRGTNRTSRPLETLL